MATVRTAASLHGLLVEAYMILVLDTTTRKLQAQMGAAATTNNCTITVAYAETTASSFTEGIQPTTLAGLTVTDILAAPSVAATRRVVKAIMIYNNDTVTQTVTVYLDDNGTDYPLVKVTLGPGANWASDDQTGVNVGGGVTDGNKGDIVVGNSGATWNIRTDMPGGAVTLAKMADLTASKLIGREASGSGVPQQIGATGGIEFTGTGTNAAIQVGAFSGDVSKTAGSSTLTITDSAVVTARLADGAVTPAKLSSVAQVLNCKNLLINGEMQISQRGTSATSKTASGYYTADRWHMLVANTVGDPAPGTWTQSIENDAPSGSGFRRSLKMTCTTAKSTLNAGDQLVIQQRLEGQNLQAIRKGTSNANQLTLSFWVKAGTTGTYIAELQDNDNTRFVSTSYSVSATNTWEKKTITFPADTSGVLDNDNAFSFAVNFWLAAGSNFTGGTPLQTSWGTTTNTRATGQLNLSAGAVAGTNYWQITGIQLERGSTATEFEVLPVHLVDYLCRVYYQALVINVDAYNVIPAGDVADIFNNAIIDPAMRAEPTITIAATSLLPDGAVNLITPGLQLWNDNIINLNSRKQVFFFGRLSATGRGYDYRNVTFSAEL